MPKFKAIINQNEEYTLKDGFIYEEILGETLDSGKIVFESDEEVDIESFDDITLFDDSLTPSITEKKLLVDGGDDEVAYYEPTKGYTYEIDLFSRTKWLERCPCPNLSVTKSAANRTVWDYIDRYYRLYVPTVYVRRNGLNYLGYRYGIESRVYDKFNSISCPEFQWNKPTLREVLTDLMSTANCIPIINSDNNIDYLELTKLGNLIDLTKIERIRSSFRSDDCCNELTINLQNAIGRSKTRITEYTSLRADAGEITTANAVLKTQKPIYDIVKMYLCYSEQMVGQGGLMRFIELDITDYIVEKRLWDTLKVTYTFYDADQSKLKANHLYYNRGGNTIEGWGLTYRMIPIFQGTPVTETTTDWIVRTLRIGTVPLANLPETDIRDLMVKIEYETLGDHALHAGKYLPSKHYGNRLIDNQSNSYVDVQRQTIFEYAKVNRLGNKIKRLYSIYNSESNIPKLGDYFVKNGEKYILFDRKIQYYDSQFVFEGQVAANFVLKDYFTGIQSKKRSWAIAEGKEALDRKDINKYYLEASFSIKSAIGTMIAYSKLLSAFTDYSAGNAVKWALIRTEDSNGVNYPESPNAYSMETIVEIGGYSLLISFGLNDNFSAGDYSEVIDEIYHNNNYTYSDSNGEFINMTVYFASSINPSDGNFIWPEPDTPQSDWYGDPMKQDMIAKGRIKNLVNLSESTYQFYFENEIYKDNREIISYELQIELCSDNPDIIVTSNIWALSSLYNDTVHSKSWLRVYYSNEETYDLNDVIAKGNVEGDGSLISITENKRVNVTINHEFKSWAITDAFGNILVAVNSSTNTHVYFNSMITRDRNIYDDVTKDVVDNMDN